MNRTENNAGEVEFIHLIRKIFSVDPSGSEQLERHRIAHPDIEESELAKDAGSRVEIAVVTIGHMRRSYHPFQSGIFPLHIVAPALHRHNRQFAFLRERTIFGYPFTGHGILLISLCVEHQRKLTRRLAVKIGDFELRNKTDIAHLSEITLDLTSERVRTIEHNELLIKLRARFKQHSQRGDIGVRTATIVLNIIH